MGLHSLKESGNRRKCTQSAAGHYSSGERWQKNDLWLNSQDLRSVHAHLLMNMHTLHGIRHQLVQQCIVLMLYTHAVIDRHLRAWKGHRAKPSRTFHRCWSTRRSSYCRKHRVCTDAKGRLKRGSTSIADAMLKVNKYNTCARSWSCNIIYILQCVQ